eukprot:m.51793 g.51793  ORF g.51793 m.51793 type:complete len:891 (+) comp7581_c0_seq1:65-2737(+)
MEELLVEDEDDDVGEDEMNDCDRDCDYEEEISGNGAKEGSEAKVMLGEVNDKERKKRKGKQGKERSEEVASSSLVKVVLQGIGRLEGSWIIGHVCNTIWGHEKHHQSYLSRQGEGCRYERSEKKLKDSVEDAFVEVKRLEELVQTIEKVARKGCVLGEKLCRLKMDLFRVEFLMMKQDQNNRLNGIFNSLLRTLAVFNQTTPLVSVCNTLGLGVELEAISSLATTSVIYALLLVSTVSSTRKNMGKLSPSVNAIISKNIMHVHAYMITLHASYKLFRQAIDERKPRMVTCMNASSHNYVSTSNVEQAIPFLESVLRKFGTGEVRCTKRTMLTTFCITINPIAQAHAYFEWYFASMEGNKLLEQQLAKELSSFQKNPLFFLMGDLPSAELDCPILQVHVLRYVLETQERNGGVHDSFQEKYLVLLREMKGVIENLFQIWVDDKIGNWEELNAKELEENRHFLACIRQHDHTNSDAFFRYFIAQPKFMNSVAYLQQPISYLRDLHQYANVKEGRMFSLTKQYTKSLQRLKDAMVWWLNPRCIMNNAKSSCAVEGSEGRLSTIESMRRLEAASLEHVSSLGKLPWSMLLDQYSIDLRTCCCGHGGDDWVLNKLLNHLDFQSTPSPEKAPNTKHRHPVCGCTCSGVVFVEMFFEMCHLSRKKEAIPSNRTQGSDNENDDIFFLIQSFLPPSILGDNCGDDECDDFMTIVFSDFFVKHDDLDEDVLLWLLLVLGVSRFCPSTTIVQNTMWLMQVWRAAHFLIRRKLGMLNDVHAMDDEVGGGLRRKRNKGCGSGYGGKFDSNEQRCLARALLHVSLEIAKGLLAEEQPKEAIFILQEAIMVFSDNLLEFISLKNNVYCCLASCYKKVGLKRLARAAACESEKMALCSQSTILQLK